MITNLEYLLLCVPVGDVSEEFGTYLFGKDRTNKLTVEKFRTFHEELTLAVLKLEVMYMHLDYYRIN